jgi:hypothetical protein
MNDKINKIIMDGWNCYLDKVANSLLLPSNEKMMQLQLAQIFQSLAPIYEFKKNESIKVLLEVAVRINNNINRSIDIVLSHSTESGINYYAIELKCFRKLTRTGSGNRGAQVNGMYDYWKDIENIENYILLDNYVSGYQFTLTDDDYYVNSPHRGSSTSIFSTKKDRMNVTGELISNLSKRNRNIVLNSTYNLDGWVKCNNFHFISQQSKST